MMTKPSIQRLAVLYSALLVAIVVAADRGALPLDLVVMMPGGDKAGHFLLMGLLCLVVNLAFASRDRFTVVWRSLLVAVVVTVEEVSQMAMRHRHFERADLAADLAGIAVFALLAYLLLARRRPASPSMVLSGDSPTTLAGGE